MRSSLALIATAGLVAVALTGCASTPASDEASSPGATSGRSSEAVAVTGDFGEQPKASFPTPLEPTESQCSVIVEGTGPVLAEGQLALVGFAVYNGATGEEIATQGFDETGPVPIAANNQPMVGFTKALTCAREGSRVAVVIPPEDGFGPNGNPSLQVEPTDSLVLVMDVTRAFPPRADGTPQLTRDGFPAVVLAPDGRPGITVPKADAPEELQQETLLEGSGEVVEDGDTVVVNYTGVLWDEGTVFDSSWENGAPATFTVGEDAQVIPGFSKAIIGQKVGSQVGVIIPPAEGYGDQGNAQIPAGSTLFFVIDILGVI
ncbi:FKBP-type peptidyl-prolyl cis-trans isomerase [Agromyces salentinus]|uniref:Peptidyl-prolyl cis-trans isomerase n=1 Tax=Agromyces salentinus TaxID=269421 RepID=A0ABP4ZB80_9MICO|nr:FKBP-type peptidyl-prolyl cis-trans isomerase [Agromyces salentinus]